MGKSTKRCLFSVSMGSVASSGCLVSAGMTVRTERLRAEKGTRSATARTAAGTRWGQEDAPFASDWCGGNQRWRSSRGKCTGKWGKSR